MEAITCLIDELLFLWFNRQYSVKGKRGIRVTIVFFIMFSFVIGTQIYKLDNPVVRLIIISFLYYLIAWILYSDFKYKIFGIRTVIFVLCVCICELIITIFFMSLFSQSDVKQFVDRNDFLLVVLSASKLCEFILLSLINNIDQSNFSEKYVHKISGVEVVGNIFFIGAMIFFLFADLSWLLNIKSGGMVQKILLYQVAFVVIVLFGYIVYMKQRYKTIQKILWIQAYLTKEESKVNYYEKINILNREVRKIKHDLKNYIVLVDELDRGITKDLYIKEIEGKFKKFDKIVNSGNEVLDVLIENKLQECKLKNIEFSFSIYFIKGEFMELLDIVILFGNILDNAMEACEQSKRKYVQLDVWDVEQFIIIKIKNSFENIIFTNGKLQSQKANKENHGIGMRCIDDAVKKYDGFLNYKTVNNQFILTIMIPIQSV